MAIASVVVPIAKLAKEGLILGPFMQQGLDIKQTMQSIGIVEVPVHQLDHTGLCRSGRHYRATTNDGALIIKIPPRRAEVVVFSIGLTPLGSERVLALS